VRTRLQARDYPTAAGDAPPQPPFGYPEYRSMAEMVDLGCVHQDQSSEMHEGPVLDGRRMLPTIKTGALPRTAHLRSVRIPAAKGLGSFTVQPA
jgi:hypothetical protein